MRMCSLLVCIWMGVTIGISSTNNGVFASTISAEAEVEAGAGAEAEAGWIDPMAVPMGMMSNPLLAGYAPLTEPMDNPAVATLVKPIDSIANEPECSPRPQTIAEIHRMRDSAGRIAAAIEQEVLIMRRRKQYVEQMTAYLNERIAELNKVKQELAEEVKWIELSQHRIRELAEREKLVKLEDTLNCLNAGNKKLEMEEVHKKKIATSLAAKQTKIKQSVDAIKAKIAAIEKGQSAAKLSAAGGEKAGKPEAKGEAKDEAKGEAKESATEAAAEVEKATS